MDLDDIRDYARHQRARDVEVLEIEEGGHHLRIRIDLSPAELHPMPAPTPAPRGEANQKPRDGLVRSDSLGWMRTSHREQLPTPIAPGTVVSKGQLVALLEIDGALTPVTASCDGMVEAVLALEGDRVDYGMPLFQIKPMRR